MTKRKPHNDTGGYVCELKGARGGYLVILDRDRGGDWIDADARWLLVWMGTEGAGTFVAYSSLRSARADMKAGNKDPGADVWQLLDNREPRSNGISTDGRLTGPCDVCGCLDIPCWCVHADPATGLRAVP